VNAGREDHLGIQVISFRRRVQKTSRPFPGRGNPGDERGDYFVCPGVPRHIPNAALRDDLSCKTNRIKVSVVSRPSVQAGAMG
jgi:hypothetical protein